VLFCYGFLNIENYNRDLSIVGENIKNICLAKSNLHIKINKQDVKIVANNIEIENKIS
jgi:hypothetical protein